MENAPTEIFSGQPDNTPEPQACLHRLLLSENPARICIVVAHPDDEVISAGAQLRRWSDAHVVYVTDGAPRRGARARKAGYATATEYAAERLREAHSALELAGITSNRTYTLGFSSQEASENMVPITLALAQKLLEIRPSVVLTHPYEGGHPDHDATAFAVHAARNLVQRRESFAPFIAEATAYFNRSGIMATCEFLPRAKGMPLTAVLSREQRAFKQRLFACFKTQHKVLQYFPINVERFRFAPQYDFSQPPHEGKLYYELFDRGMTAKRWTGLAREASKALAAQTSRSATRRSGRRSAP